MCNFILVLVFGNIKETKEERLSGQPTALLEADKALPDERIF